MDSLPVVPDSASSTSSRVWADSAGMIASIACAIHCAAMPMVIGYLPLLGLNWLADESFHQIMAVVCFGLAALAFVPGWRRHGSLIPVATGIAGVSLLSLAAFGLEGSCCPSCDAVAAEAAATETIVPETVATEAIARENIVTETAVTDASDAEDMIVEVTKDDLVESGRVEPVCEDANCQLCAREGDGQAVEAEPTSTLASWVVPLMTPFGGVLLVLGHLVNHRQSCKCQGEECCL